jgi:hypothetical protein
MRWELSIRKNTEFLRTTEIPKYVRIRELLAEKGIDLASSLIPNIMQEDQFMESGLVVTDDKRVFEFEFYYRGKPWSQASFSTWRDLTDTYRTRAFRPVIQAAIDLLSRPE